MRRGEPAASQETAASTTVFQALVQAALADAAAGAQDDEAEGEAADDAGVGEPDMSFLQAADASPFMYDSSVCLEESPVWS